jgi:hypothetical protein
MAFLERTGLRVRGKKRIKREARASVLIGSEPMRFFALKRDEIATNHHRASGCCSSMILSENRFTLFRIML